MQKFDNDKKEIIFTTNEPSTRLKANCNCKIIYRNSDCKVLFIENKCNMHFNSTIHNILENLKNS